MQKHLKTVVRFNCTILSLTIPIFLLCGMWEVHEPIDCKKFLQKLGLAFSVALFAFALAAVIAAVCHLNWLLGLHLLNMLLVIAALLCFVIFAFAVTTGDSAGNWRKKCMTDAENWNRIKRCLVDGDFCEPLSLATALPPS